MADDQVNTVISQKRRGPAPTGKGVQVLVRAQPDLLAAVDAFREEQAERIPPRILTRPDAFRILAREALIGMGLMKP